MKHYIKIKIYSNFWNCKFSESSNLNKKVKIYKNLKVYIKIEKTIIKFGDTENQKPVFHQHKKPISLKKYRYQ